MKRIELSKLDSMIQFYDELLCLFYVSVSAPDQKQFEELSSPQNNVKIKIPMVYVEFDMNGFDIQTAEKYDLNCSPCIIHFKNGRIKNRIRGYRSTTQINNEL